MSHNSPEDGAECLCCYDDIDSSNYVEYKASEDGEWLPAKFCQTCVNQLLANQYHIWVNKLETSNCKAEQRRMLKEGPPVNVKDKTALECPDGSEVFRLWYSSDQAEHSAKLDGSLEGDERQAWWDEKKAFLFEEAEEGNVEDGEESEPANQVGSGSGEGRIVQVTSNETAIKTRDGKRASHLEPSQSSVVSSPLVEEEGHLDLQKTKGFSGSRLFALFSCTLCCKSRAKTT